MDNQYTKTQLDILLCLRRKPRTRKYLQDKFNLPDDAMNLILSDLASLYYTEDNKLAWGGAITLNHKGETVAQAEYDRRFDMYFTRAVSFAALVASITAVVLQALEWLLILPGK